MDLKEVIDQLADRFAESFATALSRRLSSVGPQMPQPVPRAARQTVGRVASVKGPKTKTCLFPGCKNTAAPRYQNFCAALHKDLPAKEKAKYKALAIKAIAK